MPISIHPLFRDGPRGGLSRFQDDQELLRRLMINVVLVKAREQELAAAFLARLADRCPDLRAGLEVELAPSRRRLFGALELIVRLLLDRDGFDECLASLRTRLASCGITPGHHAAAIDALVGALREVIGASFDDAAAADWGQTLRLIGARITTPARRLHRARP